MKLYHGTSKKNSSKIITQGIDVSLGSGELGQGFYTGDLMYRAFNWAEHKFGHTNKSVLEFKLLEDDLKTLNPLRLNKGAAKQFRLEIKKLGKTKTYKFNRNVVQSPVVGKEFNNYNQTKFESPKSSIYINSDKVKKILLK